MFLSERRFIPYQSAILFSTLASPMVYLLPGVILWMGPPPLSGLVFLFGSLDIYPPLRYLNPQHTSDFSNFTYMVFIWVAIAVFLYLDFPMRYGKRLTLIEHLVAITTQVLVPFLLFRNHILIVPFPITPAVSVLALWIYNRRYKQSALNRLALDQEAVK